MMTGTETPAWVNEHRRAWQTKPGLRRFYEEEYFSRLLSMMPAGRTLEIGAGPGFLAERHRASVVTDISAAPHLDVVADVHTLPFASRSFTAVLGVDVLHHFARPLAALTELARVLAPEGRLLLIEPWPTLLGRLFYRYIHPEDFFPIDDPLDRAFPADKDPMDGNAEIPRTYFVELADRLPQHCGLRVRRVELFGLFGYLATGGFTSVYFGDAITRALIAADRVTPGFLRNRVALKAFIIAERIADASLDAGAYPATAPGSSLPRS